MTTYQLIILTVAAFIGYAIATDKNVAEYIVLQWQMLGVRIQKYYLMAKLHPRNPITNYHMNRRIAQTAKELAKKYNLPDEE